MTTDIMDLAALEAQMVVAEKVAQSLPEPAVGETLRVHVAEIGPERFRVLWSLAEDEGGEDVWVDGGFVSSHKTRAAADAKAFNVNYRLAQRFGVLAQGTSGSAQDAQRLDPQGAGPVRQDAPETRQEIP